jgi:hypothetical protein
MAKTLTRAEKAAKKRREAERLAKKRSKAALLGWETRRAAAKKKKVKKPAAKPVKKPAKKPVKPTRAERAERKKRSDAAKLGWENRRKRTSTKTQVTARSKPKQTQPPSGRRVVNQIDKAIRAFFRGLPEGIPSTDRVDCWVELPGEKSEEFHGRCDITFEKTQTPGDDYETTLLDYLADWPDPITPHDAQVWVSVQLKIGESAEPDEGFVSPYQGGAAPSYSLQGAEIRQGTVSFQTNWQHLEGTTVPQTALTIADRAESANLNLYGLVIMFWWSKNKKKRPTR